MNAIARPLAALLLLPAAAVAAAGAAEKAPTAAEAKAFVARVNEEGKRLAMRQLTAEWVKSTYITDETEKLAAWANEACHSSRVIQSQHQTPVSRKPQKIQPLKAGEKSLPNTKRRLARHNPTRLTSICERRFLSEHALEEVPGIRLLVLSDIFWRSLGDNLSASFAAFRPQIDNPIGALNHFHIMLDHHD